MKKLIYLYAIVFFSSVNYYYKKSKDLSTSYWQAGGQFLGLLFVKVFAITILVNHFFRLGLIDFNIINTDGVIGKRLNIVLLTIPLLLILLIIYFLFRKQIHEAKSVVFEKDSYKIKGLVGDFIISFSMCIATLIYIYNNK